MNKHIKFFGFVALASLTALGAAGFNASGVHAEEGTCDANIAAGFQKCFETPEVTTINVTASFSLDSQDGYGTPGFNSFAAYKSKYQVGNGRNLTLNLGGNTLSYSGSERLFGVGNGTFTVTNGTISTDRGGIIAFGKDSSAATADWGNTSVNIASDATVEGKTWYSFAVGGLSNKSKDSASGVTAHLDGTLTGSVYVNGNVQNTTSYPVIYISDTAQITGTSDWFAIYAAGYAQWNIGAAKISGDSGLGIKAGQFSLNGTTISATGALRNANPWGNGMKETGAVFQIEDNDSYADHITILVNGGSYTSRQSSMFFEYKEKEGTTVNSLQSLKISDGTFTYGTDANAEMFKGASSAIVISGGTYKDSAGQASMLSTDLLAANYYQLSDGTVVRRSSSSSSSTTPVVTDDTSDVAGGEVVTLPDGTTLQTGDYKVISGANQTVNVSDTKAPLTVRFNAHYTLFRRYGKVYVDGKLVASEDYTSRSGSTIIALTNDYLNTLANGTHTMKVTFGEYGTAETKFVLTGTALKTPNTAAIVAETSAAFSGALAAAIAALASGCGAIAFARRAAKRAAKEE